MPQNGSLRDRALAELREAIVTWKYAPGDVLSETQIGAQFSISRTPVREALRTLEQEGLVRVVPGRGVFVSEIGLRDVVETFEMREALEVYAAALTATRASTDDVFRRLEQEFAGAQTLIDAGRVDEYMGLSARLDEEIARACGNGRIEHALRSLWAQARRFRRVATFSRSRLPETIREHQEILRAILAHDPVAAGQAVRAHTKNSLENLITQLSHEPRIDQGRATDSGLSRQRVAAAQTTA